MINKIYILIIISGLLIACNTQPKQLIAPINKEQVNILLDNWHKAAAEADFVSYFSYLDSNSVFVGTDKEEVWSKKEFMEFSKPFFDKGKAWVFVAKERNIYQTSSLEILYFDEVLDTWMGECRGSGVIQYTIDGKWKIKHYVLSVIIPNDKIKDVLNVL